MTKDQINRLINRKINRIKKNLKTEVKTEILQELKSMAPYLLAPTTKVSTEGGATANTLTLTQFDQNIVGGDNSSEGDMSGILGFENMVAGDSNAIRVTINPGSQRGVGRKYYFENSVDEAWVSYCIRLGSNWNPTQNVKLPGFASQVTGGAAGGQGGGTGGGSNAYSGRMVIHRPGTTFPEGGLAYEVYHDRATTGFGEIMWWGNGLDEATPQAEAQILPNETHNIKQHIKLNTPNQNDGVLEGWLDGVLLFRRTDLDFTDNAIHQPMSLWMNVFHGGVEDAVSQHDVFMSGFNISTGPVDQTQNICLVP